MPEVELRPLAEADAEALRALHQDPGVLKWWGPMEDDFPWDEPETTRFTIDPETSNAGAIRSYYKAGFRRVGVLEAAWKNPWSGEWCDTLLMELVVRK